MKEVVFFLLFLCLYHGLKAQETVPAGDIIMPEFILSPADEVALRACPTLKLNEIQRSRTLPCRVNNATSTPFMTPIYSQSALECGQASSIAYTFSYEIDCRRHLENNSYARRYPTHFAWNFCNGGSGYGVSFMDTWEVIRTAGTPNVEQWGGWYSTGGSNRWASGYSLYYNAMKNRIVEFLAIPTDSEEGILTLKHWLHNHLRGDSYGGLANFYSTHVPQGHEMQHFLPEGTPCAGMYVVPALQSNVNHAQTIVGYNDSICWDYNGDGRYTNNLDLNSDGVVDVKDWEIGGVIFCNSFGTDFADDGYCFLPYRCLAELPAEGGIWNKCVYVVDVKDVVEPRITFKATIEHTCRTKIKVMAGVATHVDATVPEHTMEFGILNFQGGEHYMQGGNTDDQKSLEFGLDVSELLQYITPDTPAKFFLEVIENDPDATSDGQIVSFSLMDYQGTVPTETGCTDHHVPIINNGTTYLSIVQSVDFTKPTFQTGSCTMTAFHPYNYRIPVTGGRTPYRFEFTKEYDIEEFPSDFPTVEGTNISFSDNDDGYAIFPIPFEFPFYDDKYSRLCIYSNGYICFRYDTYNWPFLQNIHQQIKTTKMIAPFRTDLVVSHAKISSGNQEVAIDITASIYGQNNSRVRYVVKLFPDGTIEYYYGDMTFSGSDFISAISRGDARIFQTTPVNQKNANLTAHRNFRFIPPQTVDFLTLSKDGELEGTATEAFVGLPVSITCFDNNDLRSDTVILLYSEYDNPLTISQITIDAGDDDIIRSGEDVYLSIVVENTDSLPFNDCNLTAGIVSPYVQMSDSVEYFGYIAPGNTYTLNHAIAFHVDESTPHNTILDFSFNIANNRIPMTGLASFNVISHQIEIVDYRIGDNNDNLLGPLEIDTLTVSFANLDEEDLENLTFTLHTNCADVAVGSPHVTMDYFAGNSTRSLRFFLMPTMDFEPNQVIDVVIDIDIDGVFYGTEVISIVNMCNIDNFNSGIPANYTMSNTSWFRTVTEFHSSPACMCSGEISHNDTSTMTCHFNALRSGEVSFFFKTSTENNYDWLCFYIDGTGQGRWSGINDWTYTSYPVTTGEHELTWKYIKDYSVSGNSDAVWVDDIGFPFDNAAAPELCITPDHVTATVMGESAVIPLQFESVTPIFLLFDCEIVDENNRHIGWAQMEQKNGSINALDTRTFNLILDMHGLPAGIYHANLIVTVEDGNTLTVPIEVVVMPSSITEYVSENYNVKIYPNPTVSYINVVINGEITGRWSHCLTDLTGRILYDGQITRNQFSIDLSEQSAGIYFLQIRAEDRIIKMAKIIKK